MATKRLMRLKVPAAFWDDHADRCPNDGDPETAVAREVSRHGNRVLIEGTEAQIRNLRSDAEFYCDRWGPDECPAGLKRSAAATLAALAKQSAS